MAKRRIILEMGAGNDLHGGDYTKAAVRAVRDALSHCSLAFLRALDIDPADMVVDVTIGVQRPDRVDLTAVEAAFAHGQVRVRAVPGGLDVPDDDGAGATVVASAAIAVHIPVP